MQIYFLRTHSLSNSRTFFVFPFMLPSLPTPPLPFGPSPPPKNSTLYLVPSPNQNSTPYLVPLPLPSQFTPPPNKINSTPYLVPLPLPSQFTPQNKLHSLFGPFTPPPQNSTSFLVPSPRSTYSKLLNSPLYFLPFFSSFSPSFLLSLLHLLPHLPHFILSTVLLYPLSPSPLRNKNVQRPTLNKKHHKTNLWNVILIFIIHRLQRANQVS